MIPFKPGVDCDLTRMVLVSVFPQKRAKWENGRQLLVSIQKRQWSWFDYNGFHHVAWTTERIEHVETLANETGEGIGRVAPGEQSVRFDASEVDRDLRPVDPI